MTDTKDAIDPKILDHAHVIEHLRKNWMNDHAKIVHDAKTAQRKAVRSEFCNAFNVGSHEIHDLDDGSSSVELTFPPDWTEGQATTFATDCLDLDLGRYYRGPGQWFQESGIGRRNDTGEIIISVSWGLDI